jgi:O-antigen ligase
VETGLLGTLVFVAWGLTLLWSVCRAAMRARDSVVRAATAGIGAAFAAVLLLAIQTDIYGVPWVALSVWTLAAAAVSSVRGGTPDVEPAAALEGSAERRSSRLTPV